MFRSPPLLGPEEQGSRAKVPMLPTFDAEVAAGGSVKTVSASGGVVGRFLVCRLALVGLRACSGAAGDAGHICQLFPLKSLKPSRQCGSFFANNPLAKT